MRKNQIVIFSEVIKRKYLSIKFSKNICNGTVITAISKRIHVHKRIRFARDDKKNLINSSIADYMVRLIFWKRRCENLSFHNLMLG